MGRECKTVITVQQGSVLSHRRRLGGGEGREAVAAAKTLVAGASL